MKKLFTAREHILFILSIALSVLFISGCASDSVKKDLNQKVASESDVKTRGDVRDEAQALIENSADLTPAQKSQLMDLKTKTIRQLDELNTKSNQLRAALIDVVISEKYNFSEVKLAKSRMRDLENSKLETTFKAVDEANKILGHQAPKHHTLIHSLLM